LAVETNCYKDRPWGYLESEEYIEHYGTSPVWSNYRRNQKGGIPPQKKRNTCIVGVTAVVLCVLVMKTFLHKVTSGSRPTLFVRFEVTKVAHLYCYSTFLSRRVRNRKINSNQAIGTARDHGLLPFQVPHVDFSGENYSNSHDAVGSAPPPPIMTPWYRWYHTIQPDETEVAQDKKTNEAHLTWTRAYQRNHGEILFL
ncbi:small ribosomal subunit protein mS40-like, partial [Oncorhynchus clarkii lewisi]|uniref:small ribosomal subunit protein mS40-like n=1 Tax=Oncorhynchus clarkii lewisi TaxID=490388 RepID=UPI0039B87C76